MAVNHEDGVAEAKKHDPNSVHSHPAKSLLNMMPDNPPLHMIEEQQTEDAVQKHDQPPYPHRILNNKTTSKDITTKFRSAASGLNLPPSSPISIIAHRLTELKTGQLVKDAYFTLFEAVGALEVIRHGCASHFEVYRLLMFKVTVLDYGSKNGQWISSTRGHP